MQNSEILEYFHFFFSENFIKMTLHPKNKNIFSFHKQKEIYTKTIPKKL
jgi:hypothetical protein